MFSGIIEAVGEVVDFRPLPGGARIDVSAPGLLEDAKVGESIAVEGACLTVVAVGPESFEADLSPETLARTHLGRLRRGARVNLERSLRLGDRMGGHLVSGHVDGVGAIQGRRAEGDSVRLTLSAPPGVLRYLVHKGSVAVDGISLTVAELGRDHFTVAIIPHTARNTTLLAKPVGAAVNLEADLVGKYVERLLGPRLEREERGEEPGWSLDLAFLKEHGYA
ncbi:MAG: riboflavin synthase [Nitrospinota bacterium]